MKHIKIFIFCIIFVSFLFNCRINSFAATPSVWAEASVTFMSENGFIPDELQADYEKSITRGEFTALLVRVFELASQNYINFSEDPVLFVDLLDSAYADEIHRAYYLDIVSGIDGKMFMPNELLTREQAAVLIKNISNILFNKNNRDNTNPDNININDNKKHEEISVFEDMKQVSQWAADAVNYCLTEGIITDAGFNENKFSPQMELSREHAITMLYNLSIKHDIVEKYVNSVQAGYNYVRGQECIPFGDSVLLKYNNDKNETRIYYAMYEESVNEDKERKIITKEFSDKFAGDMLVQEGYIYYAELTGGRTIISSVNSASGEKTVLLDIPGKVSYTIDGDWIYYSTGSSIYKMHLDGSCTSKIINTNTIKKNLKAYDGWLYYVDSGLKAVRIDGSQHKSIYDSPLEDYVVFGEHIYFLLARNVNIAEESAKSLYYTDIDGTEELQLITHGISYLYTNINSVYAYAGEPLKTNRLLKITGGDYEELAGLSIDILLMNNARGLCFSDDGMLYYSVYKPISNMMVDKQLYQYTNVIDLYTGDSKGLFEEKMSIHCYEEMKLVHGKIPYKLSDNIRENEKAVILRAGEIIEELIRPEMTELEKEKALHDYIAQNCEYAAVDGNYGGYSYRFLTNSFNPSFLNEFEKDIYTPYGTLIKSEAMCQGYAMAMSLLLSLADIENYYVTGEAGKTPEDIEKHGWNIVNIDGKYYHVDVTWNSLKINGEIRYDYFNLTDNQISKDHFWDGNAGYPKCE